MAVTVFLFLLLFQPSLEDDSLLDSLFNSVDSLVSYYKDNFAYMNLDGIYGLRILEGQFDVLLQNAAYLNISQKYNIKLKGLLELSSTIAETSIKHVQASDPEYFSQLRALIEKPMKFNGKYQRVNQYLKWARSDLKAKGFDEKFSDNCMTELVQKRGGESVCEVTEQCLIGMFETGHQEYIILHQILYIMLAREHGCTHVLDSYLSGLGYTGGLGGIVEEFCSNSLFEVVDLLYELSDGLIPDVYQDLFLEQQFVCPSQGYMEFLHIDWLKQILSWQKPDGCYGSVTGKQSTVARARQVYVPQGAGPHSAHDVVVQGGDTGGQKLVYKRQNVSKEEELGPNQPLHYPVNVGQDPGHKFAAQRKLLEERVLNDGCLSHKTAVAAGALSQYIKFLLNPGSKQYQDQVSINGPNYLLYKTWYSLVFNKVYNNNDSSQNRYQGEPVDKHVDRNRQLKNYRFGRAPVDNEEERYQNQVNMPQPMYLGNNVYKKYADPYEEEAGNKEDPPGYYDDNEDVAGINQREGDEDDNMEVQNQDEHPEKSENKVQNLNVDLSKNEKVLQHQDPYGENYKFKDMLDFQKFKQEKNEEDPGYGYYDDSDKPHPEDVEKKVLLGEPKLLSVQTGESNVSLMQTYFMLLVAMVVLLVLMYRFVRKRRVLIRYR